MDALVTKAVNRYKEVSFKYFGYIPRFTINKGIIGIFTGKRAFTVDYESLEYLTDFYLERLAKNLTPLDSITYEEIEKMEQNILPNREGKGAISILLNIPKRIWERKKERNLLQFYKEDIEKQYKITVLEWQGIFKDIREWAYDCDIATDQLMRRLDTFGKVAVVFMSKDDYRKNVFKYPKLDGTDHVKTVDSGNDAWKELEFKDREFRREFIPKNKALLLLQEMILDAKENVMDTRAKKNPYRDDSISFLMNNNNDLLRVVEIIDAYEIDYVLAKMRLFCIPYLNEKERKKYGISDAEFKRCRESFALEIPRTNIRKRNGKRKVQSASQDMAPGCIPVIQQISIPTHNIAVQ